MARRQNRQDIQCHRPSDPQPPRKMGAEDVALAIDAAHAAFQAFKKTTARERARMLLRWNDLCLEHLDDLALILTLEN